MAEKENRRTKMTRRLLRDALLELMKEKDISQISIKAICELADLNRTTFYLHYQDQYALLDEVMDDVFQSTVQYMDQVKDSGKLEYVRAFLEYVKTNGDLFRTLLVTNHDRSLAEKLMGLSMQNMSYFMPELPNNEESRYIRMFVSEGSFSMLIAWIRDGFKTPVETLAKLTWQLPDLIYRGTAVNTLTT